MINEENCTLETRASAKTFYESYTKNSDNKNFLGQACPAWFELPSNVRSHWCAVAIASQTSTRTYAEAVMAAMRTRPRMYAMNREMYGTILTVLADLALMHVPALRSGISRWSELSSRLYGIGNAADLSPIDDAWAAKSTDATLAFIEEMWPRT